MGDLNVRFLNELRETCGLGSSHTLALVLTLNCPERASLRLSGERPVPYYPGLTETVQFLMTGAQKYRGEAVRLRRAAARVVDPEVRRQLLDIADQYDRLAATIEAMPKHPRRPYAKE